MMTDTKWRQYLTGSHRLGPCESINTGLLYPDYQLFSVKCVWRLQICLSSNIVIKLTFNAKQHTENSKNSFIANKF